MGRSRSKALAKFPSSQAFRTWLARHHKTASELLVRCSKAQVKEKGLTYAEAVDEALCFGWIDGVRRSVDAESFSVRFSPRKPRSHWSAVNIRKAAALEAVGRDSSAWEFFRSQAPSYRRTSIFWVMEAKREETRARRFSTLLECSAKGERIPLLRREG